MLKEKVAYDKFKDKSYITHNASEGKFRISLKGIFNYTNKYN